MFKIKGREVIKVDFAWTLDELYDFMNKKWDTKAYNKFEKGKPTQASLSEYIYLPATENCLVIAYPKKGKIIFTVADNPRGAKLQAATMIPTKNAFAKVYQSSLSINHTKEMKGPAAEACKMYANYMKELLQNKE